MNTPDLFSVSKLPYKKTDAVSVLDGNRTMDKKLNTQKQMVPASCCTSAPRCSLRKRGKCNDLYCNIAGEYIAHHTTPALLGSESNNSRSNITVNQGVRSAIADLETLFDQYDHLTGTLADRNTPETTAVQAGFDKTSLKDRIVSCAAKILSHATRGRRYPNMTHYRNFEF